MLRDGIDPGSKAKAIRGRRSAPMPEETTVRAAARRWLARQEGRWRPNHAKKVARSLEVDVYPRLGSLPLSAIKPSDVRTVTEAPGTRNRRNRASGARPRMVRMADISEFHGLNRPEPV
ncbi:phage integrase central domain-containing protein [Aurantiacibacter flavus]|uniref:phage integrase central domain-containing protein n=1 Tax=Aurantiacibacter flavus TaxID=3145232 RepID=UPI003D2005BD